MRIRNRWVIKQAARVVVAFVRLLFLTCRQRFLAVVPNTSLDYRPGPEETERYVLTVWHDSLLVPSFTAVTPELACCMVSQHSDGLFLDEALQRTGYHTVRGSARKGGAEALTQMLKEMEGLHLILTPDGPVGPRREMKLGPVFLAAQTGRRLAPGAYSAKRCIRLKGKWTDLMVPMPFTTVYVVSGAPIGVPTGASRTDLVRTMRAVEAEMNRLQAVADQLADGTITESEAWPMIRATQVAAASEAKPADSVIALPAAA